MIDRRRDVEGRLFVSRWTDRIAPEFEGGVEDRVTGAPQAWMVLISRSVALQRATCRTLSDTQNATDTAVFQLQRSTAAAWFSPHSAK